MSVPGFVELLFYLVVLLLLVKPLGAFMARVYEGQPVPVLDTVIGPVERFTYRLCGVDPKEGQRWTTYAVALLVFNFIGVFFVYALQRLQFALPLNPQGFSAVTPDSSINTAISFVTNTNWQGYGGETTMSYLTQMLGLAVQNFTSAATGMVVLIALIRGLRARSLESLGNFWVDLTRTTLYILLPLSIVLTLFLVSQGVVQNFKAYDTANVVQPITPPAPTATPVAAAAPAPTSGAAAAAAATPAPSPTPITQQTLPMGPAASQIAIKQLGTNGGGFFNVNSAHPYENPTPLSNFFETLAILLIPAALCYTFGQMIGDKRQGWAVLWVMSIVLVAFLAVAVAAEHAGNPLLTAMGVNPQVTAGQPGGNMEGKEVRFGIDASALWATVTTAASNGSVNSMHDSFTPLGGGVPLTMMMLGETIFGGTGSGLYGLLMVVIMTVFVAGMLIGRAPQYLGKKIEAYEMKMAMVAILVMPFVVLVTTAIATLTPAATATTNNPGTHGFSEILYAFTSMTNNNGSAFAGLGANNPFYNLVGSTAMALGRFWAMIPVLALAGSLAKKRLAVATVGTLPTHTPLFIGLVIGVLILVQALSFFPALALGPIAEHFQLLAGKTFS
jgi:K+-transporting ATPase ATPase A chain